MDEMKRKPNLTQSTTVNEPVKIQVYERFL